VILSAVFACFQWVYLASRIYRMTHPKLFPIDMDVEIRVVIFVLQTASVVLAFLCAMVLRRIQSKLLGIAGMVVSVVNVVGLLVWLGLNLTGWVTSM